MQIFTGTKEIQTSKWDQKVRIRGEIICSFCSVNKSAVRLILTCLMSAIYRDVTNKTPEFTYQLFEYKNIYCLTLVLFYVTISSEKSFLPTQSSLLQSDCYIAFLCFAHWKTKLINQTLLF